MLTHQHSVNKEAILRFGMVINAHYKLALDQQVCLDMSVKKLDKFQRSDHTFQGEMSF